ncbi:MAG: ATP-dependent DNA ligase [Actinomycetota bacterium]|nr:ATP-dependent DNA ligase [Actinomycetota bacterium]
MTDVADLPVSPPTTPMLAKAAGKIPAPDSADGGLLYEPKWDGFRCLLYRSGDDVHLGGRSEPLTRYFPEVVAAAVAGLPERVVLDGELVVVQGDHLQFERLLDRIHPADSRVQLLAGQHPASYVAFDLLALGDEDLTRRPFRERRALLETVFEDVQPPFHLTPATVDVDQAERWFTVFEGAGLDGVMAKPLGEPYQPGERALKKVKHERTADCVVAGYREHKSGGIVGSLLLGLHDDVGRLHHVGVSASFPMARRAALVDELAPFVTELAGHPWDPETADADQTRRPGAVNRWNAKKNLSFVPLQPTLVAEVAYDHLQGDRFRHTTQFRRWRPDRDAGSCTFAQLDRPVGYRLADVLRGHAAQ